MVFRQLVAESVSSRPRIQVGLLVRSIRRGRGREGRGRRRESTCVCVAACVCGSGISLASGRGKEEGGSVGGRVGVYRLISDMCMRAGSHRQAGKRARAEGGGDMLTLIRG